MRGEIEAAQAEHATPPSEYDAIVERAVVRTLDHLSGRQIPVRARLMREDAAARYLGVDSDFLRLDRAEARRHAVAPKFAYRRLGIRVLYDVSDLDAGIDALPRVASRFDCAIEKVA